MQKKIKITLKRETLHTLDNRQSMLAFGGIEDEDPVDRCIRIHVTEVPSPPGS